MPERRTDLDLAEYARRAQSNDCFVCKVVDGTHHHHHDEVYRDDFAVAFLNRFPTVLGYCLVAPIEHRIGAVADFSLEEYLRLQTVVHRVGSGISRAVPTERLYVLSLGSNQGNAHVHWHLAPLPPGVPYDQQQFHALMLESDGYIDLPSQDAAELAASIRAEIPVE